MKKRGMRRLAALAMSAVIVTGMSFNVGFAKEDAGSSCQIYEKSVGTAICESTGETDEIQLEEGDVRPAGGYESPMEADVPAQDASETVILENEATATTTDADEINEADEAVAAASGSCGTNVTWSYSNNTLTISGSGDMEDYNTVNAQGWSSYNSSIKTVIINDGVTSAGQYAFLRLSELETVTLASSVKKLNYASFAECPKLKTFSAPGLTYIDDYVFQGDSSLKSFTFGASLTNICSLAFYKTSIENYIVAAGNSVFSGNNGVVYKDGGRTLAVYPAGNTRTSFAIPGTVTKIEDSAFLYSVNLKNVTIPSSVTVLGTSAFQNSGLTSVSIPDSVTEAGMFTFYGSSKLTAVTFGNGLELTSYQMFEECTALTTINFGGVKELGARSFTSCTSLTSVNLPASVKEIGNGVFAECSKLVSFTSGGLSEIPFQAFLNDFVLKDVKLNEGVEKIYRQSFITDYSITSVTLPKSIKFVASDAFHITTNIQNKNTKLKKFGDNGYRELQEVSITGIDSYSYAYEVLDIVNQQRAANGLNRLYMDSSLLDSAMLRASELSVLFSHTRPDSSICFSANSLMYAENIAVNQATPAQVMDSWMNSEGHRNNILNSSFTSVGIGCFYQDGVLYWTQCFGVNNISSDCAKPEDKADTYGLRLATETFSEASTSTGVIWGEPEEYTFSFYTEAQKAALNAGETTQATVRVKNAGWGYASASLDNVNISWLSDNTNIAVVNQSGIITGRNEGSAGIHGDLEYYRSTSKNISVTGNVSGLSASGIYVMSSDQNGILMGMCTTGADKSNIEYRWVVCNENDGNWIEVSGWTLGNEWLSWKPETYGNYVFVCYARMQKDDSTIVQASTGVNYHGCIKGICQMPYTGEGGGYLIGLESYDNPNHSYKYEMLILDCTLYAQGKDAWVYSTGACSVPDNCLWTIWQPQYGYYWTLFRVYDENGTIIDEECFGFQNI